jgi:hypothetical protein
VKSTAFIVVFYLLFLAMPNNPPKPFWKDVSLYGNLKTKWLTLKGKWFLFKVLFLKIRAEMAVVLTSVLIYIKAKTRLSNR